MNKYNPQIHHRRSIRLKGYDYSQAGFYFVTICCEDRKQQFGTIENKEMVLNGFGTVAYQEWAKLPERFTNFELDVFQIMPNHMHGIIAVSYTHLDVYKRQILHFPVIRMATPMQKIQTHQLYKLVVHYHLRCRARILIWAITHPILPPL